MYIYILILILNRILKFKIELYFENYLNFEII